MAGQAASCYMLGMVLFHICERNLPPAVQNLWTFHYRDIQGNTQVMEEQPQQGVVSMVP